MSSSSSTTTSSSSSNEENESIASEASASSSRSSCSSGSEKKDENTSDGGAGAPSNNSNGSENGASSNGGKQDKISLPPTPDEHAPLGEPQDKKGTVDLDALEEEIVKLGEKMLPFTIFTKRKALDPLTDEFFAESEHEQAHPIDSLNAEMQDTDDMLANLHANFAAIGAKLDDEDHHEEIRKQLQAEEDGEDSQHINDKQDPKNGDINNGPTKPIISEDGDYGEEDKVEKEEDIQASLARMVRDHAGEDILLAKAEDHSSSEGEEETMTSALPDFSSFKTEVEKTLQKKNKRVSGQSQLETLVNGKRQPSRGNLKRNRSMPSRPGEESNFFDWGKFARGRQQQSEEKKVDNAVAATPELAKTDKNDSGIGALTNIPAPKMIPETAKEPPMALERTSCQKDHEDDEETIAASAGGYLGGILSGSGTKRQTNKSSDGTGSGGDELAFDFGTYRSEQKKHEQDNDDPTVGSAVLQILDGSNKQQKESRKSDNQKKMPKITSKSGKRSGRRVLKRCNTAPPDSQQRRSGEEFFDWKKFAANKQDAVK